eukprot:5675228-Pyramimonas_sp.AAC.3
MTALLGAIFNEKESHDAIESDRALSERWLDEAGWLNRKVQRRSHNAQLYQRHPHAPETWAENKD